MAYNQIAECFAEYAIGTCFLLLRLFARIRMGGVCSLQLDDAFAVMAIVSIYLSPLLQALILTFLDLLHPPDRHYLPAWYAAQPYRI